MTKDTRLIQKLRNGDGLHIGEREELIAALNACAGINLAEVPDLLEALKGIFETSEGVEEYDGTNASEIDDALTTCHLTAKEARISSHLVENKAQRVYSTPDPAKGKLSHTDYKVLEESEGFSLIDINLLTGRKHQIRVHFAEKGHPVVGDRKYGNKDRASKRLALHARSISFSHPFNHKTMTFDTGIPDDFARLFRKL